MLVLHLMYPEPDMEFMRAELVTAATVNALCKGTTSAAAAQDETISLPDTQSGNIYLAAAAISGTIEITGWVLTRSTGTPTISIQHLKLIGGTSTVKIGSYLEYRPA